MKVLNLKSFFTEYMFNPRSAALTSLESRVAVISTIMLGILALGIAAYCLKSIYDWKFKKIGANPKTKSPLEHQPSVSSTKLPDNPLLSVPKSLRQDHDFESLFPDTQPMDGNFNLFQLNCNDGETKFHEGFQCYEGPVIARYDTNGNHYAALLARVQLTAEMAQKVPYLPHDISAKPITEAFLTIWGNVPKADVRYGAGSEHLMFQPQTLIVGKIPNSRETLEEGLFPVNIGIFSEPEKNGGILPVDRTKEEAKYETGIPINEGLKRCQYDSHDEYHTSVMGTFDLDKSGVHAFTTVLTLDPKEEQYKDFEGVNKTMVFYQLILSDELTEKIAPHIHQAANLGELLRNMRKFCEEQPAEKEETIRLNRFIGSFENLLK